MAKEVGQNAKCVTADGTELYVVDWGTGPAIVFDHSWGLSSLTWEYQMFALSLRTWPGGGVIGIASRLGARLGRRLRA